MTGQRLAPLGVRACSRSRAARRSNNDAAHANDQPSRTCRKPYPHGAEHARTHRPPQQQQQQQQQQRQVQQAGEAQARATPRHCTMAAAGLPTYPPTYMHRYPAAAGLPTYLHAHSRARRPPTAARLVRQGSCHRRTRAALSHPPRPSRCVATRAPPLHTPSHAALGTGQRTPTYLTPAQLQPLPGPPWPWHLPGPDPAAHRARARPAPPSSVVRVCCGGPRHAAGNGLGGCCEGLPDAACVVLGACRGGRWRSGGCLGRACVRGCVLVASRWGGGSYVHIHGNGGTWEPRQRWAGQRCVAAIASRQEPPFAGCMAAGLRGWSVRAVPTLARRNAKPGRQPR